MEQTKSNFIITFNSELFGIYFFKTLCGFVEKDNTFFCTIYYCTMQHLIKSNENSKNQSSNFNPGKKFQNSFHTKGKTFGNLCHNQCLLRSMMFHLFISFQSRNKVWKPPFTQKAKTFENLCHSRCLQPSIPLWRSKSQCTWYQSNNYDCNNCECHDSALKILC